MSLQTYPEYKNVDLDWIASIPKHWLAKPNRALFAESNITKRDNEKLLSVTISRGIITQEDLLNSSSKKDSSNLDKSKYKLVEPNDIAYNKMRAWQGAIGVSKYKGIVSPAYIIHKPKINICPDYYHYLFRSSSMIKVFEKWSYGITSDQWSLRPEHFRLISNILPPYEEQEQIARYLDYKNHLINKYIRIKKKQIELLKELKQVIINDAVTGKIDVRTRKPYPKYKDSGVDWLGMIPEVWTVKKLRNVATIKPSGVDKKTNASERPVHLCNYSDVYKNEYIVPDMEFMEATVSESEYNEYRLSKGDIIITKDSEMWNDIAVPSLICQDIRDLICAYHLCLIRITDDCVTPEFLLRSLQAKTYQYQFHVAANGITRFGISKNTIKDALIAVPPIDTQNHLCDYVLSLCEKIETQIKTINSQIPYIKELQTRLFSDIVTGNLDVRDIEIPDYDEEQEDLFEDLVEDSLEEVGDAD